MRARFARKYCVPWWNALCHALGMNDLTRRLIESWLPSRTLRSKLAVELCREQGELLALEALPLTRQGGELLARLKVLGLTVIPCWELPQACRRLRKPPLCLFVRGSPEPLKGPALGIVGARSAAPDALMWSESVAMSAAEQGLCVVSGGARGVDSAAHEGALAVTGKTVAVLGVGAGHIYPAGHRDLFRRILCEGGALVTEYTPGEITYASDQVARNRLIAALSVGLVVAEAGARSGSLHTARASIRLGREIVVSPCGLRGARAGLEALIRAGADGRGNWVRAVSPIVNYAQQV